MNASTGGGDNLAGVAGDGLAIPLTIPNAALQVRELQRGLGLMTVILDDDPTGSQAVHGLPVVFVPEAELVAKVLREGYRAVFVLTNSRGLPEEEAVALTMALTAGIREELHDPPGLRFISRSDSTLRGHIVAEVEALRTERLRSGHAPYDAVIMAPAYFEAGRVTAHGIQWARIGGQFVPVAETEFARDVTFGYDVSEIGELIRQRSAPLGPEIGHVSLADIRIGGVERVVQLLCDAAGGQWLVIDAVDYADYEVVALAVMESERRGRVFGYRTGPSFVRTLLGIEPVDPLTSRAVYQDVPASDAETHGLIVVGSHTALTNGQLAGVLTSGAVTQVELDVAALTKPGWPSVIEDAALAVIAALSDRHVVLSTTRELVTGSDGDKSLEISRRVSHSLSAVARKVAEESPPRWIIAKGGITSHDLAATGLGIRRAWLLGQLFQGQVSVFRPEEAETACQGIPFVVFPGNVGDENALERAISVLEGAASDE